MTLWHPESFNQKTNGSKRVTTFHFLLHATETSTSHEISLLSEGTREDLVRRVIGFLFVAGMPEKGLQETLNSLKEIYEFNSENLHFQLPEPEVVRTGTGVIASKSEAPDLDLGTE